MSYISPVNHPESHLSGSTIESMIDKTVSLGVNYFACTDTGHLKSIIRGYNYAKKNDVKFIAGVELYFKDPTCNLAQGTPSEAFRYSKFIVHAVDQPAYQALVKLVSETDRPQVEVNGEMFNLHNWKDLEYLSTLNVTLTTADVEDIVTKHLLVDRRDVAEAYFKKLTQMFPSGRYWPSIIPYQQDKYWQNVMKLQAGGVDIEIPALNRVETNKWNNSRANELSKRGHKQLKAVYVNNIRYQIKEEFQDISNVEVTSKFQEMRDVQTEANKFIIEMAHQHQMYRFLLINNYAFYSDPGDKVVQDMKLGDEKRIYQAQHIRSTQESEVVDYIRSLGEDPDHLIKNSELWAESFKDFSLDYDYRLPIPEGDPQKLLVARIKEMGRMKWDDERYVTQFREEFELLTKNGIIDLIPYFLPITDIYDFYAKNGHLTGPARGSAGGFLISYLIGITHVDPIKYGLSSSRFLTIDRVQSGNLPDIDCDLESRIPLVGKDNNSGYLFNKYGKKAAQVSTRTLLRIKSAILDANRFMNGGTLEPEIQALSKSLPNTPQGVSDQDFVFGYEKDGAHVDGLIDINPDLKKYSEDRPDEWNIVKRALSLSRQDSRHACAYVISDADIEETVPIMEVGGVRRVTQPTHKDCEAAGLIKYDFLVVAALKDVNLCLKYLNKKNKDTEMPTGYFTHNGEKTYAWDLPVDENVFKMLWEGKTETVFQLNSVTATPLVQDIMPESVIDCAVITSLGRPGPLDFIDEATGRNMAQEYAYRKRGESKGELPILDEMLPETYGVLVFQEQVTKLAKELAGMNVIDAENVRIAVGKKKKKLIDSLKPVFIEGASKKVDAATAEQIWDMMETFARYGFNKSHAVAYSVISYACAFLKYHYPLEWWAAVLSNADDKEINEVFYKYVKDMVLPPDVNTSTEQMEIDYDIGKIRNKLSVISGLGTSYAEKIISKRPYVNLDDFVKKKVCGPALSRKLIYVGALDSLFEPGLADLTKLNLYEEAVQRVAFENKLSEKHQALRDLMENHEAGEFEKKRKSITGQIERLKKKGPKPAEVPEDFIGINSKKAFQIKKSVFPTMNLDLIKSLKASSSMKIITNGNGMTLTNGVAEYRLLDGEHLQRIDNADLSKEVYFVTPGYIMDTDVFTYKGGERQAFKMIIDSSGYVSEKVIWPNFESGKLDYDPALKKGAIVYFLYSKKPGKSYTNIQNTFIEEPTILS